MNDHSSTAPAIGGPESRIVELGIALPSAVPPIGRYVGALQTGSLLFCSGHLLEVDGEAVRGKLGREVTTEQGYAAARQAAVNMLGTVRSSVGSLDRVTRIVKLFGMVNSTEDSSQSGQGRHQARRDDQHFHHGLEDVPGNPPVQPRPGLVAEDGGQEQLGAVSRPGLATDLSYAMPDRTLPAVASTTA
jgi:enamine deaminase RidA (YjgF/YER057c/UK114 family)